MESITLEKALELTYEKLGELKNQGIDVTLRPCKSRFRPETIAKYNREGRLKPAYWFKVNLKCENKEQSEIIFKSSMDLAKQGICFDTGGGCGGRYWELDWSFHVSSNTESMEEGRKIVEGAIIKMCDNGEDPELDQDS